MSNFLTNPICICILNTKNHSLSLTFLYFMSDSRVQRTMRSQRENKKCTKKIGEKVENYLNFHIFSFFCRFRIQVVVPR
jgi:hypothetical protein